MLRASTKIPSHLIFSMKEGANIFFNVSNSSYLLEHSEADLDFKSHAMLIYKIGYLLSILCLISSIFLLIFLKMLVCKRNVIHLHFMLSLLLSYSTRLVMMKIDFRNHTTCGLISILGFYFYYTTFYWMLVEGLHLFQSIVLIFKKTLSSLKFYIFLGWCFPIIFLSGIVVHLGIEYKHVCFVEYLEKEEWIFISMPILALVINAFIILSIVYLLITKLFFSTTTPSEKKNYFRSFSGVCFLFPMLGINFLLVFESLNSSHFSTIMYFYIQPIFISFQGVFVALYCGFFNSQIREKLSKKIANRKLSTITIYSKHISFNSQRTSSLLNSSRRRSEVLRYHSVAALQQNANQAH